MMNQRLNLLAAVLLGLLASFALANEYSDTCQLDVKAGEGEVVSYDISILKRKPSDGEGLDANYRYLEQNAVTENENDRDNFLYYLNVCGPLVNTEGSDIPGGTGMYQQVKDRPDESHVGGTMSDARLSSFRSGDLRYIYGKGDEGHQCEDDNCPKRQTVIYMFCADVGYGEPVLADEVTHLQYVFVWHSCAACPLGSPIRESCKKEGPSEVCTLDRIASSMGTGNALLITFFVILAVYLLVGVAYQRFINGKRGWEQVPNYGFWTACGSNIQHGFSFVFRPCRSAPAGSVTSYKNVALSIDADEDSDIDDDADDELYS